MNCYYEAEVLMLCFYLLTSQLLSGQSGARSRDVTSKRQRRKQRAQLDPDVPVKTEPPQVQVSVQINIARFGIDPIFPLLLVSVLYY